MKLRALGLMLLGAGAVGCAATGGAGLPGGAGSPGGAGIPSLPAPPSPGGSAPSLPSQGAKLPSKPASTSGESTSKSRPEGSAETEAPASARTADERRAEVDGQLDKTLGTFDEQIRREQQRSASERDARATQRADGTAVDESRQGDEKGERDRSGDLKSDRSDKTGRSGDEKDGAGNSKSTSMPSGGGGAASKALPSGEDDDIIARRLRKAAEAETDPELKEKLWNEYRDYKANTRSGK
jgi:hypothetical protein